MAERRRISHNTVDLIALFLGALALFWLWSQGRAFYETPLHALVDHPRYDELKSGGTVGKLLGAVATAMFALNLLYLGRRSWAYVVGLPLAESEALLDRLWAHCAQPQFTFAHAWRAGDLILWDNRAVMHRRDAFDGGARRIMHRTQIKGDRPR